MSGSVFSSGALEKRMRKAHRAELEASPGLRREFKRARKSESASFTRISANMLMPVFWVSIFLAMVHKQNNIGWAAGVIALWAAGTALKWGHYWFHQFYASEDLVVLNLLPLNDRQIFEYQLRGYVRSAGWIGWELLLGYMALAFLGTPPPIYALVIAALAQTLLVLALALHSASYLHMLPLATLAGFLRMTAVVLLVLIVQGFAFTESLVRATEWFLPTGWVNYVLLRTSGDAWILLLAVPIAAIVYLARYSFARLHSFYSLEGFEIIPGSGHAIPEEEELTSGSFGNRAGPTEIEDRILGRYFLEGVNWNLGGAVEKFIARFLSPRERVITEFLVAHDPGWTRSLKWNFWIWVIVCLVVLVFGRFGGTIVFFAAYVLGAASLPLFGGDWRGMRQSAAGGVYVPGYSLYPIQFNEMARIFLKVNLVRICAAIPFITSFGALAAWTLGHPPMMGAIIGAKLLGILLCAQPLFVVFPISATTNDTSRMSGVWFLVFAPVFIVMAIAAMGVFFSGTVIGVILCYGLLMLLSGMLFLIYRNAYRKGKFDLLCQRSRN